MVGAASVHGAESSRSCASKRIVRNSAVEADPLLATLSLALERVPSDFGGGCSLAKAYRIAWLIRRYRLESSVDIGVYRGRSLVPQSLAHRDYTGGVAYGVDPWSATEAGQEAEGELGMALAAWVDTTDFDELFVGVSRLLHELDLTTNTKLVRSTSAAAARTFAEQGLEFGLIHIDGNHDAKSVMTDVELYLPLLQPGGFVVLDDVSWPSVRPACAFLGQRLKRVFRHHGPADDYAVFQSTRSPIDAWRLRRALARISLQP